MHSLIFVFVAELVLSASNWEKTNVGFHCLPNDWCDQKECTNKGSQGVATFGAFAKRVSSESGSACLERVSADEDCGDYAFFKAGHCFCTRASGSNDCLRTATWAGAYEVHTRAAEWEKTNVGFHCLPNDWCDQKECTNKRSQGVATWGAFAKKVSSGSGVACLRRVSIDKDCGDYAFSKAGHCFCTRASGSNDCVRTAKWAGAYEVHSRDTDCYDKQANTGCAYTVGSLSIDNGKSYSVSDESSCKQICDASSDCVAFEYFHYGQHSGGPMKQGTGTCYYYGGTVMGTSEEPNRSCFVKDCAAAKLAIESEQASKAMAESLLSKTTNINLPDFVTYVLAAFGFLSVLYVGVKYGSKAFSKGDYAEVGHA